ncbi:DUF6185 family protein [Streptomyces sp. NPDC048255]|uniref:DUF6185 family protein n=1 Tax=Streptomyces sp. NPDC048255 TaxID=3154713 RepID=UPI0033F7A9B4
MLDERCGRGGAIVKSRWWCLLPALIAAVLGWGGVAHAGDRDVCQLGNLKVRKVTAKLDFDYHDRIYAQVISKLTVSVSAKEWTLAKDLARSEKSAKYQTAMGCLLRGDEKGPRNREWRFRYPVVSVRGDVVTVDYEATAWIEKNNPFLLGPWRIDVDEKGESWSVFLRPPKALGNIKWNEVEVKLDGLEAHNFFPPVTSADSVRLVWSEPEPFDVRVDVEPPWQRSFNVGEWWWSWGWAGVASWWVFTAAVSLVAVHYASRAQPSVPSVPSVPSWPPERKGLARVVRLWAVLSVAVALTLRLLILDPPESDRPSWRSLVTIALGLALVLVARPWCGVPSSSTSQQTGTEESADAERARRRQVWAVTVTASAVAAFGILLVVALRFFRLAEEVTPGRPQATSGVIGLALLALVTLWLWLAAMAAWAWRFAREGDLAQSWRREGKPKQSWSARWAKAPVGWTLAVGALLGVASAALLASFWWTRERNWGRVYWLTDQFGTARDRARIDFLRQFAYSGLTWVCAYAWLLTGIALLALLQVRVNTRRAQSDGKDEGTSLGPAGADLLLTVVVFALAVGLRQVEFAGSNVLFGFWFLMMIASLYAVVTVGRRFSVLGRTGGKNFCVRRLGTRRRRHVLLMKAHEYRNLHHKLYSLDRGRVEGDLTREELERKLDGLQKWLFDGWGGEGRPPAQISVLDTALSWGPGRDWWDNAQRAARLAFGFGFPASVALVWLSYLRDSPTQMATFQSLVGLPEIVAKCLAWQVAWTGAGLALGALWRMLPGRRSPVRALSLTAAYAIPVCVGALVTQITDTELGYVFLHVALMLLVLTLTSIWMDMETFTEERRFWPSRVGLLLSVYQLRGLSTQVAYLAAQLAIVVGVWRSLAGMESRPK